MKRPLVTMVQRSTKLAVIAALTAAIAAGCSDKPLAGPQDQKPGQESQLKTVQTVKVTKEKISEPLEQVANVISSIQMDVVAKTSGDILQVYKKKGDSVNKGEVLFRIDATDLQMQKQQGQLGIKSVQAQMKQAKDELANKKTEVDNNITKAEQGIKDAEKSFNKLRNDYDEGLITKVELEKAQTQIDGLKLDLSSMKQARKTLDNTDALAALQVQLETSDLTVRKAERELSNTEVKAPISGILTDFGVEAGMTLAQGTKAGQIQQMNPIRITADLTEETVKLIRGKKELNFYVPGAEGQMKAPVSYLSDVMDSQTKAYTLELEVGNAEHKLKPGQKVQILLTDEAEQVVVAVPTLSIVREGSESFVFVLQGDIVEKRKVQLGRLNETMQEIISGIAENDLLVISGQHQLKDKEKVTAGN
ncbi:efflux RND transporter periplasmic adaptor subunit [Paenibacillus lutrae]|uniref:Efflux RND transporter periplasmic adaptor subunit n=1 Tax=Paenibacillus lutrae TaxID=2078573 RepID=A0A7X3JYS7_9BACL|nr:efflux RND transporter periplasmic adaptor subunit [Paenibacillus lutrae]MVO99331.1 efflux RND transporter periplasmic adaptor subunit [Paenibacillus lutrae]